MSLLAHGIGVVRDLPIPAVYFVGAAVVVASFVLLLALWQRPHLESNAGGRGLLPWRALADVGAWLLKRGGRWGRYPLRRLCSRS